MMRDGESTDGVAGGEILDRDARRFFECMMGNVGVSLLEPR